MKENNLYELSQEVKRIQSLRKPNTDVYKYSDKLSKKAKKALDIIEKNNNNSWALFMYERNMTPENINKIAIKYRGNNITYGDMYSKVFEYCKSLKAMGVKKGDQVPVCISNVPEYIYLLLACSFIGATIHLVGKWFDHDYLKDIINKTNSKIMFISEDNYSKIQDIIEQSNIETPVLISLEDSLKKNNNGVPFNPYSEIDGPNHVFKSNFNNFKKESTKELINQESFLEKGKDYKGEVLADASLEDISTITYTSGTTDKGHPKGVKHSNRVYITSSRFKLSDVADLPEMKDLSALYEIPVYSHTNISNVADTMCCNCAYISEPFTETEFFPKSILIYKPNYCQSTIGRWLYLGKELDKEENKNVKMPYLMLCDIVGEGCCPGEEKFLNRISRKHKFGTKKLPFPLSPVTVSFGGGSCEGGGVFTTLFHELQEKRLILYGKKYSLGLMPFNMIDFEVLNPEGEYCAINEPGLLVVNSPSSFSGYTDDSLNSSAYITDKYGKQWINMGSMCYKSEPKFNSVKMKGRVTDYVFLKDGTFFPTFKIDELITKDTKNIMSCAVIKMVDDTYVCHIEKQPTSKKSIDEILKACATRLKNDLPQEIYERIYFRVRSYEEGFPVAESGKRDFNYLRNEDNVAKLIYVDDALNNEIIKTERTNMVLRLSK